MRVGVPTEIAAGERRVALVPETVGKLVKAGLEVVVEAGAGTAAGFSDQSFEAAGAQVVADAAAAYQADVVVLVQPPAPEQVARLKPGGTLVGMLQPLTSPALMGELASRGVTSFSMELIPRITRAQKMDVLSSQATVAGYRAVLLAAQSLGKFLPMFMTAAGTIPPSKVFIMGAGVAGLQAIATARRLGAVVEAFDIRPAVKEEVESLGAKFVGATLEGAQDAGGYAREQTEEEQAQLREKVAKHVREADIVITTAQVPGKKAPVLVTEEMVHGMKPGSVIVDLAADSGGNCPLTRMDETVVVNGVVILGPSNLPATLPLHASQMYSRNVAELLTHLVKDGVLEPDFEDEITRGACVTHGGQVVHERVKALVTAGA
jgi:H+-translocating NAD(P) transhydrogenase subunit alpha